MSAHRRDFLSLVAGKCGCGGRRTRRPRTDNRSQKIRAVAFDGFPIIDPRPVFAKVEEMFPGKGAELGNAWRTRQFEYTWLRTMSGRYADFWHVTEEALIFAAKLMKLELSGAQRDQLMQSYLGLKAWPDVAPGLKKMRDAGIRMAFLSNFTAEMLEAAVRNSGLQGMFEDHLSTDRVRAYKPDPRAYQMGVDAFETEERGNCLCGLCRLGRGRRQMVRIPDLLGQSCRARRSKNLASCRTASAPVWAIS